MRLSYVTVSARIRRNHEKLRRYGMVISDVIRKALEEGVRRRDDEEVMKALRRAQKILAKIPLEEIVNVIRSSREER